MKKKLFGQNISPSCSYFDNSVVENEMVYCKKSKRINNGKCKSFRYDPLMRVPKTTVFNNKYSAEDFKIWIKLNR